MIDVIDCTQADIGALVGLNRMLIEDEGAENNMTIAQLEQRMLGFLTSECEAFFFEMEGEAHRLCTG